MPSSPLHAHPSSDILHMGDKSSLRREVRHVTPLLKTLGGLLQHSEKKPNLLPRVFKTVGDLNQGFLSHSV